MLQSQDMMRKGKNHDHTGVDVKVNTVESLVYDLRFCNPPSAVQQQRILPAHSFRDSMHSKVYAFPDADAQRPEGQQMEAMPLQDDVERGINGGELTEGECEEAEVC